MMADAMANDTTLIRTMFAGFGGQGILFAGKVMVYAGLIEGREVSWLPSYGPEMRGGTCNCSVTISDELIGSPLITECDALIAMNQPSFDKFVDTVRPGGVIIVDSTLVKPECTRDDVRFFSVPATQLAEDDGLKGLANIVLVGKLFAETAFASQEAVFAAIPKCVSAKHPEMAELNKRAFAIGAAC